MSFAANDIWGSWTAFSSGPGATETVVDGVFKVIDPVSTGSASRYVKVTLKGGDRLRVSVMARAISGQGKIYLNLNTLPGPDAGTKVITGSSEFQSYSIDYSAPHIYSVVDVFIGMGTTYSDIGTVEFFAPNIYINDCHVSVLNNTEYGVSYDAVGGAVIAFGVPALHIQKSGGTDKRLALFRTAIGGDPFAAFGSLNPALRQVGNSNDTSALGLASVAASSSAATLRFLKTRAATLGTFAALVNGDSIGAIDWLGDNGSAYARCARIEALQDGAETSGRIPTKVSVRITTSLTLDQEGLIISGVGTRPGLDAGFNFGSAGLRWNNSFFAVAPTVTSDERSKQDIEPITDVILDAWATVEYQQFRICDAVQKKDDDARIHFGLIAQRIEQAFAAAGLDAFRFGLLCYDQWDEQPEVWEEIDAEMDEEGNVMKEAGRILIQESIPGGERYGVRYEEALALEAALMRRTTKRFAARLEALEST